MKDTLKKGRQFTATANDVGKGKVRQSGKKSQSELNKLISGNKKGKK